MLFVLYERRNLWPSLWSRLSRITNSNITPMVFDIYCTLKGDKLPHKHCRKYYSARLLLLDMWSDGEQQLHVVFEKTFFFSNDVFYSWKKKMFFFSVFFFQENTNCMSAETKLSLAGMFSKSHAPGGGGGCFGETLLLNKTHPPLKKKIIWSYFQIHSRWMESS